MFLSTNDIDFYYLSVSLSLFLISKYKFSIAVSPQNWLYFTKLTNVENVVEIRIRNVHK